MRKIKRYLALMILSMLVLTAFINYYFGNREWTFAVLMSALIVSIFTLPTMIYCIIREIILLKKTKINNTEV